VQKTAFLMESIAMLVLLGMVLWQRYQRTLKRWWKEWRAKPNLGVGLQCTYLALAGRPGGGILQFLPDPSRAAG
jgi:hypothetical protein